MTRFHTRQLGKVGRHLGPLRQARVRGQRLSMLLAVRKWHALAVDEPLTVQDCAVLQKVASVLHHYVVGARVGLVAGLVEGKEALLAGGAH